MTVSPKRPAPAPRRINCRLSNLVYMGGAAVCYLPKEHNGSCGVDPTPPSNWRWLLTGRVRPKREGYDDQGRAI